MTREKFIKKWLGNKDYQYTEQNRDLMRDDLDEVINQALLQPLVSGSLQLLNEMYEELRAKEKEGFENPQELWINSDHQNAILCVMRLIQKREAQ
jgi:hypothetical protein